MFRIGRKQASHAYPEPLRSGPPGSQGPIGPQGPTGPQGPPGPQLPFANNYAEGPAALTAIPGGGGVQLPWSTIASGAVAGPDVPITPMVTGRLRILAVVNVVNEDIANVAVVRLQAQVNSVSVGPFVEFAVPTAGTLTVPLQLETTVPISATSNVEILATSVIGGSPSIVNNAKATITIQEISNITG